MRMGPVKATLLDDDAFRLLAIPFGGPIPHPRAPRGADLDGEWFSERTDIKAAWLPFRLVDWTHGVDPTGVMGVPWDPRKGPVPTDKRAVLGKAGNLRMEEDGWWVDVWLDAGEQRVALVRALAERGAQLFGSSESIGGLIRTDKATGEVLSWPYWRQTLSTSPQNTLSVVRPIKAVLHEASEKPYAVTDAFWTDIQDALGDLGADLRTGAKAGRVLSSVNERALSDALSGLDGAVERLREVLARAAMTTDKETPGG